MKKTIFAAAFAALTFATSASAELVTTTTCGRSGYRSHSCVTSSAFVTHAPIEQRTEAEIEKFNSDWDRYCKPQRGAPDRYGVVRMIYAHPDCEFGATGDRR